MRKRNKGILVVLIASLFMAGCQTNPPDTQETQTQNTQNQDVSKAEPLYKPTDEEFLSMKDFIDYLPRAPLKGVKEDGGYFQLSNVDDYTVMQGGCSDGRYMYLILENNQKDMDIIFKVDMKTWEIVKQSEPLPLHHGNGMGYNSKENVLIVSHNTGAPKDISLINPETLEIIETKSLKYGIYGICYNPEKDWYVVGISGSSAFAILDTEFVELGYYDGHQIGLANQSISCDSKYIYIGNSGVSVNPGVEVVKLYDWTGEYKGIFRVDSVSEQEAFIPVNGKNYITFYTGNGGRVYEIEFDYDMIENP